jgi:sec-independent protein translocase protein TatC
MKLFRSNPGEMPFLDHLEELRWRLIWSLGTVVLFAVVGFLVVWKFDVLGFLEEPITPFLHGQKLVFLDPMVPFFITLKIGILLGIVAASPVVIYHLWSFLAPALTQSEKRAIMPSLYLGVVLFASGVALSYYLVLPATLEFTMGFQTASLQPNITIDHYMSVVIRLLLAFGIVFEMPVVILALSVLGVVTPELLASKRRYAIAIITVVASVVTPGDVVTITIMMMVPLVALYELSIFLSRVVYRNRARAAAALES